MHGALFEGDPNFTPVKFYRKRINVSEINPFPNLLERIGGLEGWLMAWVDLASSSLFKMLNRLAWKESVYNPVEKIAEIEL